MARIAQDIRVCVRARQALPGERSLASGLCQCFCPVRARVWWLMRMLACRRG